MGLSRLKHGLLIQFKRYVDQLTGSLGYLIGQKANLPFPNLLQVIEKTGGFLCCFGIDNSLYVNCNQALVNARHNSRSHWIRLFLFRRAVAWSSLGRCRTTEGN